MDKKTKKIIQKKGRYYTEAERHAIIQQMLKNHWTKQYTWELYTGEPEEKGNLLRWMRKLGYIQQMERNPYVSQR
ncbi:MAG: hypothetical protein RML37_05570, partial [Chitinophagales bacterium]|nr:hypothetical protein [Chitinophagales bacterium]